MRSEELSHLELLLRLGVLVVVGEIGLPEVMQSADAGVAVVDAFRRNKVLAGIYGEKYLLVDLGTHSLRYLLGDDGIHILVSCLQVNMKTPRKAFLRGVVELFSWSVLSQGDFIKAQSLVTHFGCRTVLELEHLCARSCRT